MILSVALDCIPHEQTLRRQWHTYRRRTTKHCSIICPLDLGYVHAMRRFLAAKQSKIYKSLRQIGTLDSVPTHRIDPIRPSLVRERRAWLAPPFSLSKVAHPRMQRECVQGPAASTPRLIRWARGPWIFFSTVSNGQACVNGQ